MKPAAVIFDCDGVLVDSEHHANTVLSELLAEHGVSMTPDECRAVFVGLNPRGVGRRLLELRGVDLTGVLVRDASARFMRLLERVGVPLVEGVGAVLAGLAGAGVPVAAASNSPIEELRLKLRLSGLAGCFGPHVHSGDAIGRSKPDPAVYLAAAAGLGVAPGACVVVEDTVTGVRAGVAAGMRVIGFTGTHPDAGYGGALARAGAAVVAASMAEVGGLFRAW